MKCRIISLTLGLCLCLVLNGCVSYSKTDLPSSAGMDRAACCAEKDGEECKDKAACEKGSAECKEGEACEKKKGTTP